eukprot:SAG22_NODE_3407_length_1731_cov_1.334559_2_plen_182_part_00
MPQRQHQRVQLHRWHTMISSSSPSYYLSTIIILCFAIFFLTISCPAPGALPTMSVIHVLLPTNNACHTATNPGAPACRPARPASGPAGIGSPHLAGARQLVLESRADRAAPDRRHRVHAAEPRCRTHQSGLLIRSVVSVLVLRACNSGLRTRGACRGGDSGGRRLCKHRDPARFRPPRDAG